MQVTTDEYELPLAVADSVPLLARMTGKTTQGIYSAMCKAKKRGSKSQYVKVEIEGDEDGF